MPAYTIPANLPTAWFDARTFTVNGQVETVPPGIYTDPAASLVEGTVYDLRDRREDERLTHAEIAERLNLGHWRISYNVARNLGRRRDGENGRDYNGDLTYRSWNQPRNMRTSPAAPARQGSRSDSSLVAGMFGIEIEFNAGHGAYGSTVRHDAVTAMQGQGISVVEEHYNHTTRPHWKMTTDATVTGGECVSPIMAGDTASLDEVRDVIRAIKAAGGTTASTVGMHVHHNVTHFTTEASRRHLIRTLANVEGALAAYVLPVRAEGTTSCGAGLWRSGEAARLEAVAAYEPGATPNITNYGSVTGVDRYRFFNIDTPIRKYGTVEFRGLGGTLHAGKVRVWVRMGQAVIEAARLGMDFAPDTTPDELVTALRDAGLIGRRTGEKFLAEVARRQG